MRPTVTSFCLQEKKQFQKQFSQEQVRKFENTFKIPQEYFQGSRIPPKNLNNNGLIHKGTIKLGALFFA